MAYEVKRRQNNLSDSTLKAPKTKSRFGATKNADTEDQMHRDESNSRLSGLNLASLELTLGL